MFDDPLEKKDVPRGFRGGVRTDAEGRYRLEGVGHTPVYWVFAAHLDFARGVAAHAPTGPADDVDIVLNIEAVRQAPKPAEAPKKG